MGVSALSPTSTCPSHLPRPHTQAHCRSADILFLIEDLTSQIVCELVRPMAFPCRRRPKGFSKKKRAPISLGANREQCIGNGVMCVLVQVSPGTHRESGFGSLVPASLSVQGAPCIKYSNGSSHSALPGGPLAICSWSSLVLIGHSQCQGYSAVPH